MRALLISDGAVVDAIVVDSIDSFREFADADYCARFDAIVEAPDGVGIGWTYADGVFSPPPQDE